MELVTTIEAHPRHAQAVCFSVDGKRLFTGAFDPAIKVWSVPDGGDGEWEEVGQLDGHAQSVNVLELSPGGTALASASTDRTVRLWNTNSLEAVCEIGGHRNTVVSLSWAQDGGSLASASYDGTVRVWPGDGGDPVICRGHDRQAFAVTFTAAGGPLVSGGRDELLHAWDPATGEEITRIDGPGGVIGSLAWDESRGALWASGIEGGVVRYSIDDWSGTPVDDTVGLGGMKLSPDGSLVAMTGDYAVYMYESDSGERLERIELPIKGVYGSAWSPDGSLLAVAGADGRIRVWSVVR